jgi:hypothetical protein
MSTKGTRTNDRSILPERRHSGDRRASAREGAGLAPGRRSSDRSTGAIGKAGAPRKRRATSDGREPLVVYMRPESIRALKIAALEDDTTASAIVAEATDAWLRSRGRPARR